MSITCSGFLDDEFTIDPIGDTHFNGSQDNGPLSGDHWETELMGAKTTSGMYVLNAVLNITYMYVRTCIPFVSMIHQFAEYVLMFSIDVHNFN